MAISLHIFRIIDVNFNRAKEGLRVIEDIFRFILRDNHLRKWARKVRHSLDKIVKEASFKNKLIKARSTEEDLGKDYDFLEKRRKSMEEVLYINLQRVKESLRVLEEFLKLIDEKKAGIIKKTRFKVYELEKYTFSKWPSLRNTG
ncbi:MAG: thiamine-phosphate pyrophosphorylase [Candidatus Omnitrophota bacterium]|nr:MAG: thiamine-phosphate pyrophosphorylase [Candidatus Omnitrophota bacterium]RKY46112.1 MAG: thiamine-phosphate pyrophosphorylase [Candidatus Omnitrophota bacterium]HDN86180.1 thiamine-phosphate pyrophosphorylase [Candidatus Omnitrophota bacterium]